MIPNAYCKKHDEIEPNDWDCQIDGLWVCPTCSKESFKRLNKPNKDGKKPLDLALEKLEKEYPNLFKNNSKNK